VHDERLSFVEQAPSEGIIGIVVLVTYLFGSQ
jgi:hypothetical protein